MLFWLTVYPLLTLLQHTVEAKCPEGCLCANNLIVCTCIGILQERQKTTHVVDDVTKPVILSSFRGIEYISKIYVHSCRNLIIANDTFEGLDIGQEMTIMNVANLHIQPYAFRKMLKYPNRMTIKDSGISEISENAFAGFTRTNHLWFKNVTVANIRKGAFAHVSHVEYVYFRESTLENVEAEAFADMTSIVHFFVRGKVSIDRLGAHLFRQSSIANITFEEAHVNFTSPRAFAGAKYFGQMQFQNCTFLPDKQEETSIPQYDTENGQKVEFFKTTMEEIQLSAFSNVQYVRFEEVKINEISPPKSPNSGKNSSNVINNISRLYFMRSAINHVTKYSFAYTTGVQSITFDECSIEIIEEKAFFGSRKIDYVIFINSKIGKFAKNSFENVHIEKFILDGCEFNTLEQYSFENSNFASLKFISNHFGIFDKFSLAKIRCEFAAIESNKFGEIDERIFDEIYCDLFNFTDNSVNRISDDIFRGTFFVKKLNVNFNKFPCECQKSMPYLEFVDLDNEKALQDPQNSPFNVKHNFCWISPEHETNFGASSLTKFYNSCFSKNSTAVIENSFQNSLGTFSCQYNLFWTICRCVKQNSHKIITITDKLISEISAENRQTSGLLIADCHRIRVKSNSFENSNFNQILIFESRHVEFENSAFAMNSAKLLTFSVKNSNISQIPADLFAINSLENSEFQTNLVEFRNCTIKSLKPFVFRRSKIGEIRFVESKIGEISEKFAAECQTTNFTIQDSTVGHTNSHAFNDSSINNLKFQRSKFVDFSRSVFPAEFYRTTFVCLLENQFACGCDSTGVAAVVNANGCDDVGNVCGDFSTQGYGSVNAGKRVNEILKSYSDSQVDSTNRRCYVEQTSLSQKRAVHLVSPDSAGLSKFSYLFKNLLIVQLFISLLL